MSSDNNFYAISASDLQMIQSVLDDAGYDANVLATDQRLFNTAALLVMKLFLVGETSPYALLAQLERKFGRASENIYKSPFARYAIQGLPRNLRRLERSGTNTRPQRNEADLQSWENEGGSSASTRHTLPSESTIALAVKEGQPCPTAW